MTIFDLDFFTHREERGRLIYAKTDCFIVCYSLVHANEVNVLNNIENRILSLEEEVKYLRFILVGLKSDELKSDAFKDKRRKAVSEADAAFLCAKYYGFASLTCSSLNYQYKKEKDNVELVFQTAARCALTNSRNFKKQSCSCTIL